MNGNNLTSDTVEGTVRPGSLGKVSKEINIHTMARMICDKGYMINIA